MRQVTIGWREWVGLPALGVSAIKAKVDTGARTSALHAVRIRVDESKAEPTVHFSMHPVQRSIDDTIDVEVPLIGYRDVRSSDGRLETRPLIRTALRIGKRTWPVDLTLTGRGDMGFRILLGRAAVRRRFLVDPGGSFLVTQKARQGA